MTVAEGLVVLLVEDHDFQRGMVARMVRSMGAEDVIEAVNGRDALALIQSSTPVDLVICDLDMPEMDGMAFIRHLGQLTLPPSVIVSSAMEPALLAAVEKMAAAYGIRLLGVVEKPLNAAALEDLIALRKTTKPMSRDAAISPPNFSLDEILQGLRQKQFTPFFQPKVNLATNHVVGTEALARWDHPEHGVIGPYAFIAPLEQSGHIDELTFLMLEKAAIACAGWRKRRLDLEVAVNLSFASLTDTTMADRITDIVHAAGLDPNHMILEITETVAMTDIARALENLTRLRMHGFGLSIDDYGTGFSSMQQLTRVPFTELKVDQSFVMDCATNSSSRAVVESSLEMARRLKLKSTAEGVETQAAWDSLKSFGCDTAQGYFIAKPMEERQFLEFCTTRKVRMLSVRSAS